MLEQCSVATARLVFWSLAQCCCRNARMHLEKKFKMRLLEIYVGAQGIIK
jgi:hypothetical protein